jgi:hypothetical protein
VPHNLPRVLGLDLARVRVVQAAVGSYNTPKNVHGESQRRHDRRSCAYSFTAYVAKVTLMSRLPWRQSALAST